MTSLKPPTYLWCIVKTLDYQKIIRGYRRWFNDPSERMTWFEPRRKLQAFVDDPKPHDFPAATTNLQGPAAWHARRGCVLIAEGNTTEGWSEVARSFDYRLWLLRVDVERVRIMSGRGSHVADATRDPFYLLNTAAAFRRWRDAAWIGDTVLRTLKTMGWYCGPIGRYSKKLYAMSGSLEFARDQLGPYSDVFLNWQDTGVLADAIWKICDYHVEQLKAHGEFDRSPYDIFPSEILALYRVREKLGLETPWVKHPLLDTPFTQVPENITYEPDPLVVQAMDLVTKLLPEAVAKR